MGSSQRRGLQILSAAALLALTVTLSGCQNFFVCSKASCSTSGSSTSSVNYVYASDSTSGATYINTYTLSSGTLVAPTTSAFSLGYTPSAMVVANGNALNKYLYVGSNTGVTGTPSSNIYGYSIGTSGALTILSGGNALLGAQQVAAMDISPDGKWLFVLAAYDGVSAPTTLTEYAINSSTGALTLSQSTTCVSATGLANSSSSVKVAPSANYIAVALGAGGVATYGFNTSTGFIGAQNPVALKNSSGNYVGVFDVGVDSNNYLFMAGASGLNVISVDSTGTPGKSLTFTGATGASPFSVAVAGNAYAYSGATTGGAGALYQFKNAGSGSLTALSPASVTGPTAVTKIAVDSSGKYVLALGANASSGLQMFSIGSDGSLTLTSSQATSATTGVPAVLALTH